MKKVKKVYGLYLKATKSLYAVTTLKEERDLFLEQRNSKCFEKKSLEFDKPISEYEVFSTYRNLILRKYPILLDSDGSHVMILVTRDEEQIMEQVSDAIPAIIEDVASNIVKVKTQFDTYILADEYKKIISLLKRTYMVDKNELLSTVNTYALFVYIFKFTFDAKLSPEDIYKIEGVDNLIPILNEYCPSLSLLGLSG